MSEQLVPSSIAQRIVIKFLTVENVKASEIFTRIQKQFGDNSLKRSQVYEWHQKFSAGRNEVANLTHRRRPKTSRTAENEKRIRELIVSDRRITISEIASELGISYVSVHSIISTLGFRKLTARWVPRLLSEDEKCTRVNVALELLRRCEEEGSYEFLERVLTCDETWVHYYTPEKKKKTTKEWRSKEEPPPTKPKTRGQKSAGKVLCTVF